jgi:hypothetical protein
MRKSGVREERGRKGDIANTFWESISYVPFNFSYVPFNFTLSYAYDPLNQLTGVTANNANYNESYSYTNGQQQDLNGNRSSATIGQGGTQTYGAPAAANRLTSDGQYTYTYESAGNVASKWGYENQVLTTYPYTWDFRNRLTEVTKTQNGSAVADDKFTSDVFDRLIGKQVLNGSQTQWTA